MRRDVQPELDYAAGRAAGTRICGGDEQPGLGYAAGDGGLSYSESLCSESMPLAPLLSPRII